MSSSSVSSFGFQESSQTWTRRLGYSLVSLASEIYAECHERTDNMIPRFESPDITENLIFQVLRNRLVQNISVRNKCDYVLIQSSEGSRGNSFRVEMTEKICSVKIRARCVLSRCSSFRKLLRLKKKHLESLKIFDDWRQYDFIIFMQKLFRNALRFLAVLPETLT